MYITCDNCHQETECRWDEVGPDERYEPTFCSRRCRLEYEAAWEQDDEDAQLQAKAHREYLDPEPPIYYEDLKIISLDDCPF